MPFPIQTDALMSRPGYYAVTKTDAKTCLHLAAATGIVKFVDALLRGMSDETGRVRLVNLPDKDGQTALHIAANRTVYATHACSGLSATLNSPTWDAP